MTGMRWGYAAIVAIAALAASTSARGQNVVPGGWSSEIGVQAFESPGEQSWAGPNLSQVRPGELLPPLAMFGGAGAGTTLSFGPWAHRPQVVNGLLPLADTVKKSGRKRSRW
jgi:hypothetical protein